MKFELETFQFILICSKNNLECSLNCERADLKLQRVIWVKRKEREKEGSGDRWGEPQAACRKNKCRAILYFGAEVSVDLKKFRPLTGQKFRNLWAAWSSFWQCTGWSGLDNFANWPNSQIAMGSWLCGTPECELDNSAMWTLQFSKVELANHIKWIWQNSQIVRSSKIWMPTLRFGKVELRNTRIEVWTWQNSLEQNGIL